MKRFIFTILTSCSILVHIKGPEARIITLDEEDGVVPVPIAMIEEDLNNDGFTDLAIVSPTNTVGVMLGRGDGTFFSAGEPSPVGLQPNTVTAGDFNGDAKLDLATVNNASDDVSVLLGNGDGTFQAALTFPATEIGRFLSTADINQDGDLDLFVGTGQGGLKPANVLLGNGDGSFQAPLPVFPELVGPQNIKLVDLDQDGHLDLVTAGQSQTTCCDCFVLAARGNGDGSFRTALASRILGEESINSCGAFDIGDIDGDGILDVVSGLDAFHVGLLMGNGDGTFKPPIPISSIFFAGLIQLNDFNQDGSLDLLVMDGRNISLFLANESSFFQLEAAFTFLSDPFVFSSPAIGDLDQDNVKDIILPIAAAGELKIILGIAQ